MDPAWRPLSALCRSRCSICVHYKTTLSFARLGAVGKSINMKCAILAVNHSDWRCRNRSRNRYTGIQPARGEHSSIQQDRRLQRGMKSAGSLQLKTFLFILLMVVFGPLGNVLLGKGMKRIGAIHVASLPQVGHLLWRILTSPTIWAGIAALLSFFVAYLLVLSWADYSYVQPASSVSYAMVALLAHFLLREAISPLRWLGVLIICLGVLVVGYTPPRTTETR
jgi:hypothetical protein